MNLMTLGRHWRTAPVAACLVVFLTASRVHAAGWYDAAWSSRKKITIDSAQVMATLTDFPFMVSMTDADLQAGAQADGDDILFTDDDGTTKLDHDIEVWEDSSGNLVAWVRIPTLPDTVDKEIYLYYGNSSATDQRNATGVWVNYVGVWHLNETSGTRYDSTSNGNHLTDQNTVANVPGKIGGCADLEESASERLYITDAAQTNLDITGNMTMQAWVKPESVPGSVTFLDKYAGSDAGYRMRIHSSSWFEYSVYDGATNEVRSPVPVNPPDTWYFLVGVYDGSDVIIYTDAADPDTISHSGGISTNSEDFEIGARGNDKFYDGLIDEVRIATVPRTLEWVQTEFNNQSSADFYQVADGTDAFNFLTDLVDISQGTAGSWVDVDVSTWVPSGATGVMLEVKTESSSDWQYAVREKGSTDTWMVGPDTIKNDTHSWFMIGLDANLTFQLWQESTSIDTYLIGYTMGGVPFFTDAYNKTPASGSWQDVDISAETGTDTAIGAIFIIQNTGDSQSWSIRMNGASDDRGGCGGCGGDLRTNMSTLAIVGVDSNEICEIKTESSEIKAYLVGYVTSGAVFFQEPIDVSVAAGSYVDVDITPHIGSNVASGAFVQCYADFDDRHQTAVRKNGATYDYDKWTSTQFAPVAVDTSYIFEAKTDDADGMEFWLFGYAYKGASTSSAGINYRSIGTDTAAIYQAGDATVSSGSTTVTFGGGASLPTNVGQGDELVVGSETFYILSRNSATEATVQTAATSAHSSEAYTIKRAYNDPQSWETARGGDLVGDDRREVGVCYNDGAFTTGINIRDNTTDAGHYMTLTVAEGQRHNGTAASGARFDGVVDDDVIELDDPYTVVEWLEIANFSGTAVEGISIGVTGPNSLAQNLLIHDFTGAKHAVVVYPVATLRNSIIYNGPEGIRITNGSADATLENLTIWNVTDDCVDLDSGNSLTLRNCILLGAGDVDLEIDGTVDYLGYTMYSTWSGQDPETFDGNNQSPPADLDDLFVSIAASSEDLHLEPGGHNASSTGLDLSGSFSKDIDGETRSAPWDLGADEGGTAANYRSIGTDTSVIYQTGDASISAGGTVVTFGGGASLPANIGQGDELVIGAETFYIYSRDSITQVTVQTAAAGSHSSAAYTISRAYNDIQSWEDARDGDLVGEERREVGVCYNDGIFAPAVTILIEGSITDGSHYMKLTVAEGQRHNGTAGTGVRIDAPDDTVMAISDEYTVIEWLEVYGYNATEADGIWVDDSPSGANSLLQNLLIHDYVSKCGIVFSEAGTARNCIIYNGKRGIYNWNSIAPVVIENCTIWNMSEMCIDLGSSATGGTTIRNCIALGGTSEDVELQGPLDYFGYTMYETFSGTDPETMDGNNQTPPADLNDLFYSIAASSEDLHLEDSGHNALDTGLDLTSSFSGDIDGDTRSAPWDLGADEITALPLRISSAANQTFTVGDATTAISAITVTDHGLTPVITAANDIRIRIPAAFNMDWDVFETIATITGSATAKVSTNVSYEASDQTLVIDVTSDFAASDAITISDLKFTSFTAVSSTDYLILDVNNDATADATDDKTIEVEAAPPPPSTNTPLVSWREVEPEDVPAPSSSTSISFDDVTPNVSTDDRNSASFAHTVGSCSCCSDSIIVVVTVTRGDQEATDVSYGGQALALAISEQASTDSGNEWVKVWYRTDPLPGTNMVDVTFDITEAPTCVTALSYFGVDQSSPIGAVASDSDISSSNPVTVNISTTVDGSVVVGGLGQHGGDTDPHDQGTDITTEHWDEASGSATSSDSSYAGGEIATSTTGIYTFEWDGNASDDWAIACVELKPAQ